MAENDVKVECLFSLEVVVEKLYMPHVVCRFPALAFRLLDFPTILIHHVEPNMATRIQGMISEDPEYQTPPQFAELKDKHGNFMVKKGKSCLFKISLQSLRTHLTNTPLYVMVVDTFTETPKLLGNSTVPLDTIMENIYTDVSKVGNSIPSVHGDKGLFKIYNLMGKEIGYVILGYRLLSVGPSLVPHLSEQVFAQRGGKSEELPELDTNPQEENLIESRPSSQPAWTSTDNPQQNDVLLQTDEFEKDDKCVSANLPQSQQGEEKVVHSISTQTSGKQTKKTHKQTAHLSFHQKTSEGKYIDDHNSPTNVCCPPPLFYYSKNDKQTVWLSRRSESPIISETNFEDYSDIVSEAGDSAEQGADINYQMKQQNSVPSHYLSSLPDNAMMEDCAVSSQNTVTNNNVFPILSALIQELGNLQLPPSHSGMPPLNVLNLLKNKAYGIQQQPVKMPEKIVSRDNYNSVQDDGTSRSTHTYPDNKSGRLSHRACAGDHQGVPKNKSWLRSTPEQAVKKSKLTFGMTNTHRLRLAKSNPHVYKKLDHDKNRPTSKQRMKPSVEQFDEGNLSDMSTEIRRHTLDDIEDSDIGNIPSSVPVDRAHTAADKTTETDKMRVSFNESVEKVTVFPSVDRQKRLKSKRGSPKLTRKEKWPVNVRAHNNSKTTPSKKSDLNASTTASNSNEDNNQITDTPTEDTPRKSNDKAQGAPQELLIPDLPQYIPYEPYSSDSEENYAPSHRSQKSIEVRLPSTEPQSGEESTSPGRPDNGASKMSRLARSDAYWDSLEQNNQSANESDGELGKSYVPSWGGDSDIDPRYRSSGVFSSTGDLDTRQFQSTEEAELLDLISDGGISGSESHSGHAAIISEDVSGKTKSSDKASASTVLRIPVLNPVASEASPIPSTRRSIARPDFSAASAKDRTEQPSPTSSVRPTPRPRSRKGRELDRKESLHTESVSTYAPSDVDNMNTSLASDPTYSEDFHLTVSDDDTDNTPPVPPAPRFIPSTKLGYTIS